MNLKRKKKNIIPKNITKQNIDLFNTALNNTQGNACGVAENLREKMKSNFNYNDYTDEEIRKAMDELRNDYTSDSDMLEQFFEWCDDKKVLELIERDFAITPDDEFTEEIASEIIDEFLYDVCLTLDEPFIQNYLESNFGANDLLGESLIYNFDDEDFEYEPSEEDLKEVIDEYVSSDPFGALELLIDEYDQNQIEELVRAGWSIDIDHNSKEDNDELLKELMSDWTNEELADIFLLQTDLLAHCKDKAREEYEEEKEYRTNPDYWYDYNGVSRKDFR